MRALTFKAEPLKALIEGKEYSVNYTSLEVMKAQEAVVKGLNNSNEGKGADIDGIMELYKDFFIKSLGEDKWIARRSKHDVCDRGKARSFANVSVFSCYLSSIPCSGSGILLPFPPQSLRFAHLSQSNERSCRFLRRAASGSV